MPRTLAARLGFADDARVAVVHADDIGMCHAANRGAFEALEKGPATCGSLMVPCAWFPEAVALARAGAGLDLGVHLTLNSEWDPYRWPPVAGARQVPSLVDTDGCLYRSTGETLERGRPEEVELELRAQIERALAAGIDVTHLDAHMGTAFFPPFLDVYLKLVREYRVAAFMVKPDPATLPTDMAAVAERMRASVAELEQEGFPVLDGFDQDSLNFAEGDGLAHNRRRLDGIGPGVHYLICHPAVLDEELAVLTPEAHCRDFERGFYGGEAGRRELAARSIETIGMRPLRDLVRAAD